MLAFAFAFIDDAVTAIVENLLDVIAIVGLEALGFFLVEQIDRGDPHHQPAAEALFDEGFEVGGVIDLDGLVERGFDAAVAIVVARAEAQVPDADVVDETEVVDMVRLVGEAPVATGNGSRTVLSSQV